GEVDALLDLVPRTSQRVVISAGYPDEIEDLVERRVKKAIRYPAEPAIPEDEPVLPISGTIGYVVVAGTQKLDLLGRQLSERNDRPPPILFFGLDERAAVVAEQLSVRGFVVGAIDDIDADVAIAASETTRAELAEESDDELGQTISFDVPPDAATLLARHGGDADAVVL